MLLKSKVLNIIHQYSVKRKPNWFISWKLHKPAYYVPWFQKGSCWYWWNFLLFGLSLLILFSSYYFYQSHSQYLNWYFIIIHGVPWQNLILSFWASRLPLYRVGDFSFHQQVRVVGVGRELYNNFIIMYSVCVTPGFEGCKI